MSRSIESAAASRSGGEQIKISSARNLFNLPIAGVSNSAHSGEVTAKKYGYERNEDGSRVVDTHPYKAKCVCEACVRTKQPAITADNWGHALEKILVRHAEMRISRVPPEIQSVRPRQEQSAPVVEKKAHKHKPNKRRKGFYETSEPFVPPHLRELASENALSYTALQELLMKGYRPEYIRKHYEVLPGRAQTLLDEAVAKSIAYGVLVKLLREHGKSVVPELKKYYLIPDPLLEKVLKKLGK